MILAIIVCLFDFAIIHMRLKNALIEIQQLSLNDNYHAQTKLFYNLSITTLRSTLRFKAILAAVLCIGGIHSQSATLNVNMTLGGGGLLPFDVTCVTK